MLAIIEVLLVDKVNGRACFVACDCLQLAKIRNASNEEFYNEVTMKW